jgi:hypothetical protein
MAPHYLSVVSRNLQVDVARCQLSSAPTAMAPDGGMNDEFGRPHVHRHPRTFGLGKHRKDEDASAEGQGP